MEVYPAINPASQIFISVYCCVNISLVVKTVNGIVDGWRERENESERERRARERE